MGKKKPPRAKNAKGNGSDDDEEIRTADEYFSRSGGEDSDGDQKAPRVNMYCKNTHYIVVKEAGKCFCDFHLTKREKADWDIAWFDGPINVLFLKTMLPH